MLSLATSIVTIIGFHLVAKKRWEGWAVGLANQALWLALILQTRAWGLLLLNGALVWIYSRALIGWRRTHKLEATTETPDGGYVEPVVSVPLYSLCDLVELTAGLLGDDGFEGLSDEDKQSYREVGDLCTQALQALWPQPPATYRKTDDSAKRTLNVDVIDDIET